MDAVACHAVDNNKDAAVAVADGDVQDVELDEDDAQRGP